MVALRAERAKLLGYESFAHYRLDDAMAKTPEAVRDLLERVWAPARARALASATRCRRSIARGGRQFRARAVGLALLRREAAQARCDLDEAEIKPYLQLDQMIEAAFDTAQRLFGLSFARAWTCRSSIPTCAPGRCAARDGRHVGLFFGDYFARPSKRSGAWMTSLRDQEKLAGDIRPIVVNVMNFSKAARQPTLLSFDDARTLFHEFGHALHGLLSDVTYPMISGTSVLTDFVELPSQLYEHWLEQPEVLRRFAVHTETGEPMPGGADATAARGAHFQPGLRARWNMSPRRSSTSISICCATPRRLDVNAFEQRDARRASACRRRSSMRHRPPHFAHVFSGGGYAAAYYSYMWSEVLDADAFAAFEEAGDIFDPATAQRAARLRLLRRRLARSGGGLISPFRGRLPTPEALLEAARLRRRAPDRHDAMDLAHRRTSPRRRRRAASCRARRPGRDVLAEGGNALEAMVAMAATIAAVYPHMNHIGGDGFWLVREPSGPRARDHGGGRGGRAGAARALSRRMTRSRRAGRSRR